VNESERTRIRIGHYPATVAKTHTGYSAHVPSLPGLGVTGTTFDETVGRLREGIRVHREALVRDKAERPWLYTGQR
jgi:predicted RNase H-like HicB family nuclease